ncbi:hypothetical protein RISK_003322 [Rhodopirellula islandica]|uniref:Uncharacterized protein n=1 Tax=Rhodopirellula islandica TaxID=595434 RepID=A0A0J1BDT7_RHOIS|nr:hypothetical protein RISK_003322 [Rhodopirellula islandica]
MSNDFDMAEQATGVGRKAVRSEGKSSETGADQLVFQDRKRSCGF